MYIVIRGQNLFYYCFFLQVLRYKGRRGAQRPYAQLNPGLFSPSLSSLFFCFVLSFPVSENKSKYVE